MTRNWFIGAFTTSLLIAAGPWPAAGEALQWKVSQATAAGPPYPSTSAVGIGVFRSAALLPAVQHSLLTSALEQVTCDGSVRPSELNAHDTGAAGLPGNGASLGLFIDTAIQETAATQLLIKSFSPDGLTELPVRIRNFSWNARSFDVEFDELFGDGSVHKDTLHGEVPANQPFGFRTAAAAPGSVALDFTLGRIVGEQVSGQPIVTMSLSGEAVPEPAVALLLLGGSPFLWRRRRGTTAN